VAICAAAPMVNGMGGGSSIGRQIGSYTLLSLPGGISPQIIDIDSVLMMHLDINCRQK